ncbi:MAG: ABC transporter substrate-binding protein [Maritimibacter sp.]
MTKSRLGATLETRLGKTTSLMAAAAIGVAGLTGTAYAQDNTVKVGFVTFLSGGAAGPFGVPARNAAELMVQAINAGSVPGVYSTPGLGGAMIEPIFVDENSKQKNADYLKLVEKDGVEMVIGYISSGSCKAIAPEAEKAETLTILFDCGTPQIFEEIVTDPKYTFRTGGHATMDGVAAR